jgi:hypothetical protein
MRIRSLVAAVVIVAFSTVGISPAAWAGESAGASPAAHVDFQKAIAKAVRPSSSDPHVNLTGSNHANQPAMQAGYGGGGGGHMMMIMSLVGMVAGIGMTYYMIKQMQKTTNQAATAGQ